MEGKASSSSANFTRLFVLLCLSHLLLSSLAVPATRGLNPRAEEDEEIASSTHGWLQPSKEEDAGYGFLEGRVEMEEKNDYPGAGASHHHDPKSPGLI